MYRLPPDDPATYALISRGDTIGTFQIESRAQMSMLPRTKPRTFYDLVIQVAIVRPGPIQGDMVHPYLRRLEGLEEVTFPTPELGNILGKTLGVPLFQEQAMKVVITCAGFSPGQADLVRRAQATFKKTGGIGALSQDIINGMLKNGYTEEFAQSLVKQLEGFGSYGFPESHAFSFAIISEASSWMKCHHPDVFLASILNSQPMGFYAPAQLIRDAKAHGVEIRWFCVNKSRWDCTLEPTGRPGKFAVRLGYRLIKGIRSADVANLIFQRGDTPYKSIPDLWRRAKTPEPTLRKLAKANAYEEAFRIVSRDATLAIKSLGDDVLPLFDCVLDEQGRSVSEHSQPVIDLKRMTDGQKVIEDYNSVGFSQTVHPVHFLRTELKERGYIPCQEAMTSKDKRYVSVAGLVNVRQRPGSANGVIFMTIEDESGDANVVVWEKVGEQYKQAVFGASLVLITGYIQKEGDVVHLIARTVVDLSHMLASIGERDVALHLPHQPGDEFRNGGPGVDPRVARQTGIQHKSRDYK
jgi:error-prone DNA polymerase